ncbi:regulatory protein RecX [Deinococcus piscis]|uniref:Regulatory protein RecX n=1 Tax=Deinococcus piscis TaxID=394230 RepID=A0ABQ3K914_9DEIO|nr:RecX family transcriptional regulator [Deinococcus piscis]GHG09027.1 regulatory protein RecX [Deinococcus piscis]
MTRPDADPRPTLQPDTPEWDAARERLLNYAFAALSRRALSEAELHTRLQKRSDQPGLIQHVLDRVKELGYQNDEVVAEGEARRRGVGAYRVRQKLKQRGLDEELITEVLEARDPAAEEEDARQQLARRLPSFARKKNPRASAYAWLTRRGYSADLIRRLLDEVAADLPEPERPARASSFGRTGIGRSKGGHSGRWGRGGS